jgi:hypothetical protein
MRTDNRLKNAFARAAKAKGWDTGTTKVGAVFLEHHISGWSIGQVVNEHGGTQRLCNSCEASKMLAWLRAATWAE